MVDVGRGLGTFAPLVAVFAGRKVEGLQKGNKVMRSIHFHLFCSFCWR